MTDHPPAATPSFAEVAKRVQNRLIVRKGLQWLVRTWPYGTGAMFLLIMLRLLGHGISTFLSVVLLILWVVGCFAWAYHKRPGAYSAMAFWDQRRSRNDAFANAWWFESQPQRTPGQQSHLDLEKSRLGIAVSCLHFDLPLPNPKRLTAPAVLAAVLMFLPKSYDATLPDPKLTAEGREMAKSEGRKLENAKLDPEKMKGLSEDERKEMDKVQKRLLESAKTLSQGTAKTSREVLGELEKRARDAEHLAEKLGAGDSAWASEQMVAELRKHADTAEMGDAVASRSSENTAQRAQEIADKLKDPALSNETRTRFTDTLRDIGKKAQPEDKERTVGQHVIAADKKLTQALALDAAREFQSIADKMRTLASREKAREQLEKLAQQLRDAGSKVAGQGTEGMQQLQGAQGDGGQGAGGQTGQMLALQNAQQPSTAMAPSFSNAPQSGQGEQGTEQQFTLTPVQGAAPGSPMPNDGKKDGDKDQEPTLFAPIPGGDPNQKPDMAMLGTMPGMLGAELSGAGGAKAGKGTAPLGNKPTAAHKAGQTGVVNAQRNTDGASSVRSVEGQVHEEQARRAAEATALAGIAAEANALDDAALPPARREQVRRYFTELRKRFEKEN